MENDKSGQRKPSRTLFDPAYLSHAPQFRKYSGYPYPWVVSSLYKQDDHRFDELELCIFDDVLSLEHHIHIIHGGYIAGPITIQIGQSRPQNLRRTKKLQNIPAWVESDGLRFSNCKADGIVFVERMVWDDVARWLNAWQKTNHILYVARGVPRVQARRALHRLAEETGLPVYVLTDCDTWGYFIYSVLKRGMMAPHEECPYLAIKDAKFIGLRVGEFSEQQHAMKPWKDHWSLRLRHLRKYQCFRSPAWQRELRAFEEQHASLELWRLLKKIPPQTFIKEYVLRKIKGREWLS